MASDLNFIERMDLIAERMGGFYYPWVSTLGPNDGEAAYTALVETHLWPQATVLEAGCGHGRDMVWFAPKVERYVGYDLSEGMIRIAQDTALGQGLGQVELVHANSSAGANGGHPRIPMEDASVDLIISRRGPTNFIADARRVCRPGSWLIQLNPLPAPTPAWDHMLPEDLRAEPDRDFDVAAHIRGELAASGIALHSAWTFDVPEHFAAADQLYAYLAWNRFYGMGRQAQPFETARPALEWVMAAHGGAQGLEVRRRRFLWAARID
ncbi:MAG TPA: class I SAM-dependent methyltransferase [Phenylobacterium sp.]|nr:class I SAM-dependent methyltransferase [Phenylobacterium sp.]